MRCRACGLDNQAGAAHCRYCGSALGVGCTTCGEVASPTARFCSGCGAPVVRQSTSASSHVMDDAVLGTSHRGERRHLTVMFCDLVESTALAELLDPEETSELVLAYQEMGHPAVTELGGYVAQYLGDGLLIYFGCPTAHEDDAERAVRAGLAIVAGLEGLNAHIRPTAGVQLAARVGIHTGPTIVGAMGSADRSDISVFGSTPNIAARLEVTCATGHRVDRNTTRRLLDTRFRLSDRGRPALKGVRQDIHVWEVAGVDVVMPRAQAQPPCHSSTGRRSSQSSAHASMTPTRAPERIPPEVRKLRNELHDLLEAAGLWDEQWDDARAARLTTGA